ncbi:D-arabinono-1,4-lactone oxidase [Flavitalea flava]
MQTKTNWAGNYRYSTSPVKEVASPEELIDLVKRYDRLKILGTRHCFNHIADSKDHLLSLIAFNKIDGINKDKLTVTVEAGVRYGELAVYLESQGYALHNLASLPHISIVGGCATATHGSGWKNGNLSTAVRAMEMITADGELAVLSIDKDSVEFAGAVVHLGGLGIITKITLAIEPTYTVRQFVYEELPLQVLEQNFEQVMSAGYSVSLFTDWRSPFFNEVWIKSRGEQFFTGDFFGARAARRDLHPIGDLSPENCTGQMGVPGPWYDRLPHFRMGFTPSSGKELQTEYFVPRDRSVEAIKAISGLQEKIAPHLLISEIRCIAGDDLWMSPCYRQDSTAIHFTWKQDWPAVAQLLPLIEVRLAPFNAKPHWGKLFTTPHQRIQSLYDKLPDFKQMLQHYDPKGKFRNEYLDNLLTF